MKYRFLCANYRHELINRPERAMSIWNTTHEAGLCFVDGAMYYDALPHFGSAFEIAEILLSTDYFQKEHAITVFTNSALYLASTLNALRYQEQKSAVLEMTVQRLRREQDAVADVNRHIQAIQLKMSDSIVHH